MTIFILFILFLKEKRFYKKKVLKVLCWMKGSNRELKSSYIIIIGIFEKIFWVTKKEKEKERRTLGHFNL